MHPGVGPRGFFSTSAQFRGPVVSTGQRDWKGADLWEDCILLELLYKSEVRMVWERDVQEDTDRCDVQARKETTAYGIIHPAPTEEIPLLLRNSRLI